ncbi:MAG: pyridoxamine 5'-phosphate oxidase, partial [Cyanobacteria bacterium J06638_38]
MLAPWRSLLSGAIHRNRSQPHSRYFQLATVTPEGYPANRTVVFRG